MGGADHTWLQEFKSGRETYARRNGLEEPLWRGRTLDPYEVGGLARACSTGLAALVDEGTALVTTFNTPKRYQLYSQYDGGRVRPGRAWSWSWQEVFTQLAFAAELVLDHGWSPRQVALEVDHLDVGAGKDPVRTPLILAEAKLNDSGRQGLDAMMSVFIELSGGTTATVAAGVRSNAVPKYECLLRLRPPVFVAIAPGTRRVFDVAYDGDRAKFGDRGQPITPEALITSQ